MYGSSRLADFVQTIVASKFNSIYFSYGEPTVLVHHVSLIDNHGIIHIIHCRWHCGLLVTRRPYRLQLCIYFAL